jgi:hypothetical protein
MVEILSVKLQITEQTRKIEAKHNTKAGTEIHVMSLNQADLSYPKKK